jgi:hypothetical protein
VWEKYSWPEEAFSIHSNGVGYCCGNYFLLLYDRIYWTLFFYFVIMTILLYTLCVHGFGPFSINELLLIKKKMYCISFYAIVSCISFILDWIFYKLLLLPSRINELFWISLSLSVTLWHINHLYYNLVLGVNTPQVCVWRSTI